MTVEVLTARTVPLGGLRALNVRRTLPHRSRSTIGAWCFIDHYGPEPVRDHSRDGMDVPPHPHIGLQTVSWLFAGAIEHRDSGGAHQVVRPGELNLMTSGHGIAHSEVSTAGTTLLHGVQLWVALPGADRNGERRFDHYVPPTVGLPDGAGTAQVFLGELTGLASSPIPTATPLVGAELNLQPGSIISVPAEASFEYGVLVDSGSVNVLGQQLSPGDLGCVATGSHSLLLEIGETPARIVLVGGEPFEEEFVMWWNFVARSHDEIAAAREEYEAGSNRFGRVEGYTGTTDRIPAPQLPPVRLRPRVRH